MCFKIVSVTYIKALVNKDGNFFLYRIRKGVVNERVSDELYRFLMTIFVLFHDVSRFMCEWKAPLYKH